MKKLLKDIITLLMIMWFMGSLMYIAGEPPQIERAVAGFTSLGLCVILWRELSKRDLIINDK